MTPAPTQLCGGWFNEIPSIEPNFFPSKWVEGKFCKNVPISFFTIGKQIGINFHKNPIIGFSEIMEVVL